MDLEIAGKRALVTGASDGLGLATARGLAAEGVNVVLCARRRELLDEHSTRIREEFGVEASGVAADLSSLEGCESAMAGAVKALGGLDILVNNAAASMFAGFDDLPDEQWLPDIELKLMGYVRMTRLALEQLRKAGGGRIVNVAGNAGKQPLPFHMSGATANAGVLNFTKSLSLQVGAEGIFINAICPGPVLTARLNKQFIRNAEDWGITIEEASARYIADLPLPFVPTAEEVANTVIFLASPKAAYINGTSVTIDGGITRGI